jgi:hypothetical protein
VANIFQSPHANFQVLTLVNESNLAAELGRRSWLHVDTDAELMHCVNEQYRPHASGQCIESQFSLFILPSSMLQHRWCTQYGTPTSADNFMQSPSKTLDSLRIFLITSYFLFRHIIKNLLPLDVLVKHGKVCFIHNTLGLIYFNNVVSYYYGGSSETSILWPHLPFVKHFAYLDQC